MNTRGSIITVIFILAIFFVAGNIAVQAKETSLKDGAWALQFEIDEHFQPVSFDNSMISVKHHFSDKSAWRLSARLSTEWGGYDGSSGENYMDDYYISDRETDKANVNIDVTIQYLRYPAPEKDVNLFWAIGPLFRYSDSHSESQETNNYWDGVIYGQMEIDRNLFAMGVSSAIGVEWFFHKQFSLLAEYSVDLSMEWSKYKNNMWNLEQAHIRNIEESSSTFSFRYNTVKFGLSAYF